MNKKYALDMTSGPFLKKILIFSLPLMLTGILQLIYNTADVVVVGRFAGADSLAAVGSTGSLVNLILNVFFGISMGSGVVVARYIGAQDSERIRRSTHTAMLMSVIFGIAVGAFGFIYSRSFLIMMKIPDNVLELATVYLKIYFMGTPGSLVYNFGASILRATGDTKRPLYILAGTGIINILLNLLLVIVLKMDVSGVAIATIVAQYISAVIVVVLLVRLENDCKLHFSKLRIHFAEAWQIIKIGVPAGVQNSLFSVSNVIIQSTINTFGSAAIAGVTAGCNFEGYIYTATNAIAQTTMTFTSQNVGANKKENLPVVFKRCMLLAGVISAIMCLGGYIFSYPFISIFSTEEAVIEIGVERMRLALEYYVLFSFMDVIVGQLRGMGKSFVPMLVSLIGVCGVRLGWIAFFLPHNPTLMYMFWAYPLSWGITFAAQFVNYGIVTATDKRRQLKKSREDN